MNRSLFLSVHALVALLVAGGFLCWLWSQGYTTGRAGGSDAGFLLWSGWVALALYVVVVLYSLRKYVHKLGISPEFKLRIPLEVLERTERGINELRRRVMSGVVTERSDVQAEGKRILKENGAHRVMRVAVSPAGGEAGKWRVDVLPTEPLGRVAKWLHAHLYYGVAAGVLVWLHGGANFSTPMGFLLNASSCLVIGTGIVGVFLWAWGPGALTRAEKDLSIEEAFVLEQSFGRKLDAALEPLNRKQRGRLATLKTGGNAADVLEDLIRDEPGSAQELRDIAALAGQYRRVSGDLRTLQRTKLLMSGWRAVHVPLTVFLVGLLVVHVVSVWWY